MWFNTLLFYYLKIKYLPHLPPNSESIPLLSEKEHILASEFNQDLKAFIIDPRLQGVDDA